MAANRILVDLDGGLINNLINWRHNPLTTSARLALSASLTVANIGLFVFDITLNQGFYWTGSTWVTPVSSGGLITANNGLTASGTNVQLGGSLIQNTVIDLSTFYLSLQSLAGTQFVIGDVGLTFQSAPDINGNSSELEAISSGIFANVQGPSGSTLIYIEPQGMVIAANYLDLQAQLEIQDGTQGNVGDVFTSINNQGLGAWVTPSTPLSFDNGLTKTSNVVELGGTLLKNTTINLSTFEFDISSGSGNFIVQQSAGILSYSIFTGFDSGGNLTIFDVNSNIIFIETNGPSGTTELTLQPQSVILSSKLFNIFGVVQIEDGSQGHIGDVFTSIDTQGTGRWITPPSAPSGVTNANDGLSVSGSTVKLGQSVGAVGNPAALTENRQLPMSGFSTNFDSGGFTITNPNPYFFDITVPSGGGTYFLNRVNFNTPNTAHTWAEEFLSTDNGDGSFDHVQAQGFWGNGNTIPNWFESIEYQYLSDYYERHIQFQAYSSELRLASYTYVFSGIDFSHDSCIFYHSVSSFAVRSMGTQHEGLFYTGGAPTFAAQLGFGNDDLAGGTLTGYIEKCDSVNHKISLQNNGNDPSGTSYEFQGFGKIYFDIIGSHSIFVDTSDWSLHADGIWVANPLSNTFFIDNASSLDLQINFQPSRNSYHMIVSTATAEWGDYIPSPNGYSRTFYWGTTQMLSLSKSVALFSTAVQIKDGSQGTIGNVFTSIDVNGTGRWEPVSITGIAAGGDLSGTFPNPTVLNSAVIGKVLTGYVSGAGVISPTDTILSAIEKLNGNIGALVTGVSSFNTRTGAITLLSSDVTGALGYTPQPAGNYITALTGDVTAAGPGSSVATLATVNANVGSFGDATHVGAFTVNAKGLITAASAVAIAFPVTSVFGRTGAVVATTGDYTIAQITNGLSNVLAATDIFVGSAGGLAVAVPLSGDATITSAGALTIGANKITYAKIQQASADTLIGNPTGSLANVSEITLGSGLSFVGTTLVATGTGGTVTTFSAGNLSPLFTSSVANPTTTPALTFSLSNAGAWTIFGNDTSGSATPTFFTPVLTNGLFANEGTTTTVLHGNAAGNLSFGAVVLTTDVSGILPGTNGGTGVNNGGSTITIGGNHVISGAFASTFTLTGPTVVTFPTSGTLLTTTGSGASLTGIPLSVSNVDGSLIISPTTGAVVASLNVAHANTWTAIQSFTAGDLLLLAGTAAAPPITFTTTGAVLMTTPTAGDMEVDSKSLLYYTNLTTSRAKVDVEHFVCLTSPFTLVSQTAAQALFNATATGAITLAASTTYFFECEFTLSAMSSTSGNFGAAFGGTATLTSIAWNSLAYKTTVLSLVSTPAMGFNTTTSNVNVNGVANGLVSGSCRIWGIVRVNASGTFIPQVSLSVAAPAVVGTNSYFRIWPVGSNVVTNLGAWT